MTILNLKDVQRAHQMLLSRTGLAVQRTAISAGQEAVKYVQQRPTFTPRTGNLQRKTDFKVVVRRNGKVLQLRNAAKYAHAIDQGSGLYGPSGQKYMIAARRRKALRFVWKGVLVFRRYVMHPGVKPRRFLRLAAGIAGTAWFHDLEGEMTAIARKF